MPARKPAKDLENSDAALLRTSADILSHALTQTECMTKAWPQYKASTVTLRTFVETLVVHAREYGYIEKRGKV